MFETYWKTSDTCWKVGLEVKDKCGGGKMWKLRDKKEKEKKRIIWIISWIWEKRKRYYKVV